MDFWWTACGEMCGEDGLWMTSFSEMEILQIS
jgi:hypothetical protein